MNNSRYAETQRSKVVWRRVEERLWTSPHARCQEFVVLAVLAITYPTTGSLMPRPLTPTLRYRSGLVSDDTVNLPSQTALARFFDSIQDVIASYRYLALSSLQCSDHVDECILLTFMIYMQKFYGDSYYTHFRLQIHNSFLNRQRLLQILVGISGNTWQPKNLNIFIPVNLHT